MRIAASQLAQAAGIRFTNRDAGALREDTQLGTARCVPPKQVHLADRGRLGLEPAQNGVDAIEPPRPLRAALPGARVYIPPPVHYDFSA
jgi:hypothetical protein